MAEGSAVNKPMAYVLLSSVTMAIHCKNKRVTLTQLGLSQWQFCGGENCAYMITTLDLQFLPARYASYTGHIAIIYNAFKRQLECPHKSF